MRRVTRGSKVVDKLFEVLTGVAAASPIAFLLAIFGIVLAQSIPTIQFMGWRFITQITWNMGNTYGAVTKFGHYLMPAGASYGALPFIVGTLSSSVIALLIGVPISILTALILAYQVRGWFGSILSIVVELLAGIPSVIFGLWGLVVLVPWVNRALGPFLVRFGSWFPPLRGPVGTGYGLLTSGIVLALMIVPIITATTRDLLKQVPILTREGGIGLGMTSWEVVRLICLPAIREGLVGSIALGWGRAMGETMAVLMVSGSAMNYLPQNVYSPITTMAAFIANQLDSASADATHMATHALSEIALVLMALTLITNLLARALVNRTGSRRKWGVGAKA